MQQLFQSALQLRYISGLAFPHYDIPPPQVTQLLKHTLISLDVLIELFSPEYNSCLRCIGVLATGVTMPETPMNEDCDFVSWQHDIGHAGQVFAMQAKPVAHSVEKRTYDNFGLCVLAADPGHVPAAVLGC